MKKENSLEILNDILLKMNYDTNKTLSENRVIIEQGQGLGYSYNKVDDKSPKTTIDKYGYQQGNYKTTGGNLGSMVEFNPELQSKNLTSYVGISGPLFFDITNLKGIASIEKRTNWLDTFSFPKVSSDCPYTNTLYPFEKNKSLYEKKLQNFFNGHIGHVLSFTLMDGSRYFATPLVGCEDGRIAFGGYKNLDTGEQYVPPKLSLELDSKVKEISNRLVSLTKEPNVDTPEGFSDFLYDLRDIVSSTTFQIFAAALSVAIAAVAGPWAVFFSKLLDWGIDIIVLIADTIAALRYPENSTHFQHMGEDIVNLGLSFGLMGVFKAGSKMGLKGAVKEAGSEGVSWLQSIKNWVFEKLDIFIGWLKGTKLAEKLTNFKNWVGGLFGNITATVLTTFVTVGLPVAGLSYAALILANPILQPLSGIISEVVGIPLTYLQSWAIGDEIPEQYAKKAESINSMNKEEMAKTMTEIEVENAEILKTSTDQRNATNEMLKKSASKIENKNKELVKNNNDEYCKLLISELEGPCKDYLQRKLDAKNLEFIISGENGGVVMVIDSKKGYAILTEFDPDKIVDKDKQEVNCAGFQEPKPIESKG